jgi:hypothetical protein
MADSLMVPAAKVRAKATPKGSTMAKPKPTSKPATASQLGSFLPVLSKKPMNGALPQKLVVPQEEDPVEEEFDPDLDEDYGLEASPEEQAEEPPLEEDEGPVEEEEAEEPPLDEEPPPEDKVLDQRQPKASRPAPGEDSGPSAKKRRMEDAAKAKSIAEELTVRWGMKFDFATRYVLTASDLSELEQLRKSSWRPNPHERNRRGEVESSAMQANKALLRIREAQLPRGDALDAIDVFAFRWRLSLPETKKLRALSHKDLRHVINNYDGEVNLDDVIAEAEGAELEEEIACPEESGIFMVGRFNRLELIDPEADALVVGDANMSFSVNLVHHRKALHHTGQTVCTTFEKLPTLRERYPEIDSTINEIQENGGSVIHDVDCTRIGVDPRFKGMEGKFGAVYYNFPHAGVASGFIDGHPFVRWRHENLMHLFFRALRSFCKTGAAVKVSSNAMATGVRFSDIMLAASTNEFVHVETVPFQEWTLKDYLRSYGDRRDVTRRPEQGAGYNAQGARNDMVYSFCYQPSGDAVTKPRIRYPPSKQDLMNSSECNLRNFSGVAKERKVEEIYQLFLSYVKGIHIG